MIESDLCMSIVFITKFGTFNSNRSFQMFCSCFGVIMFRGLRVPLLCRFETKVILSTKQLGASLVRHSNIRLEGYSRHSRQPSLNISHIQIHSLLIYRK